MSCFPIFFSNFSLVKIIWTVRKQLWSWYIRNIFCPDNLLHHMNPVKGEGRYADDWTQRNSCSFLKDCTVYSHCSLEHWQVNSCGRSVRSAPHCNLQMHTAQTVHWPRSCIRSRNSCRCFLVFQIQLFPRNFPLNNENNASCVKNIKLLCSMCIGMVWYGTEQKQCRVTTLYFWKFPQKILRRFRQTVWVDIFLATCLKYLRCGHLGQSSSPGFYF